MGTASTYFKRKMRNGQARQHRLFRIRGRCIRSAGTAIRRKIPPNLILLPTRPGQNPRTSPELYSVWVEGGESK